MKQLKTAALLITIRTDKDTNEEEVVYSKYYDHPVSAPSIRGAATRQMHYQQRRMRTPWGGPPVGKYTYLTRLFWDDRATKIFLKLVHSRRPWIEQLKEIKD